MTPRPFTASTLQPVGATSLVRGEHVHTCYSNRHAVVRYDTRGGELWVSVELAGGYSVRWRTVAARPSVGMARKAAEAAYRGRVDE